jgi:AcrR family transcriptional regulator
MSKGDQTRERILRHAMRVASRDGLEGLSIGELAAALEMSKSGLFAHFGSKEELQLEVLRTASREFEETVVRPALKAPRGVPRLRQFFENWIDWATAPQRRYGCIFAGAAFELDDRPGPAREYVAEAGKQLLHTLTRTIELGVESGALRPDLDCELLAFQLHSILLGFHHDRRLLRLRGAEGLARRAFEQLMADAVPA